MRDRDVVVGFLSCRSTPSPGRRSVRQHVKTTSVSSLLSCWNFSSSFRGIAPAESSFNTILQIENSVDHFPYSHVMNTTKREELERAYKKEEDPRVAARMLAVHMVYVRKQSISETAANLVRSDRWVHT